MKNDKIVNAYEEIRPDDYAKQRVWNKVTAEKQKKRSAIPRLAAVAAVLAIMVFANSLFPVQVGNSFTARAYTLGQQADGIIEGLELSANQVGVWSAVGQQADGIIEWLEFDFSANQAGMWSAFFDGTYLYLNIRLDVTGENIASAEFSTAEGFFVRHYADFDDIMLLLSGLGTPHLINTTFEPLGTRIASVDMQVNNYLFFLAIPHHLSDDLIYDRAFDGENPVEIQVDVVFHDGERQSEAIALDFGDRGGAMSFHPDVGTIGHRLTHIELEYATLIPESVQIIPRYDDVSGRFGVDMYVWEREGEDILASRLLFRNSGDEQRYGLTNVDGRVILHLIRLDENGDFVGMEYILPDEIARNFREYWITSPYWLDIAE